MNERPLTEGEYRVGIDFNPSGDPKVKRIKELSAELIDICNEVLKTAGNRGITNTAFAAMERIEDAAMWAVKAVTKKPQE